MADDPVLTITKSEPLPSLTIVRSEPVQSTPSDASALGLRALSGSVSPMANMAAQVATSPTFARGAGTAARVGTTLASIGHGLYTGNPSEIVMSPVAGWSAGKGGYWLGKGAQSVAGPIATALDVLKPYAQAISTVSGAQGVLDLAQMADKTRQDIGTLGVAFNTTPRTQAERDAQPALLNYVASKIGDLASALMKSGVPAPDAHAVKLASGNDPSLFGKLMTLYMQAKSSMAAK